MKRHLPFTRRQLIFCSIFFAAIILHVASLCTDVAYYGPSVSFEFGNGFFTLFWGGDANDRNFAVCNAGEWPLRPETHFAGEEVAGNGHKLEEWIQSLDFDQHWFPESIQHKGFFRTFGYSLPQLRREDEAASFLVPLGSIEAGVLYLLLSGWRSKKSNT
jgi:hypothetical protein